MRKFFTNAKSEEPPLIIVSTLAIMSIIMHLVFPQHTLVVKADKDIKPNISQKSSFDLENQVLIDQEKKLEDKPEIKEELKQTGKVLAVQAENDAKEENTEENNKINKTEKTKIIKKLVLVTAYSSTVDQCDSTPFITANGTHVHDGTIAANFLKFGTKVRFPSLYGDKVFIVEDRMKSNYKVDIWFPTRQEAINFGAKRVEMEIL